MNAQHPIRSAFGHLPKVAPHLIESVAEDQPLVRLAPGVAVQSVAEPLPSASEALGRLESSLAILDAIAESTLSAVHHLERATIAGAGQRADMGRLEDVAAKLSAAARRAEAARSRVADKLAGAR